ncbi:threonylcarbamoyl-AMP synthase [Clostridium sp. 19966]|uniref:L-threonylcarbamoyladenylate synthase n=1 Tax=Clostridium sp. 19966 TaxID=2768166 RepID=UPI0028DFBF30|nr:L-threonylcarbamoyladenylate synthase [Clostridium sp. 19966]MDT8715599.1 threonylcarbamoyl-AMP synthase [Clostridium sp. 19966]
MDTKIIRMMPDNIDYHELSEAAEVIKNGGLVVFPTETVYGLGADATNGEAAKKIFEAKGRPQDNPLIIHVADFSINEYVKDVPKVAKEMMDKFWPGPLTIILNKSDKISNITSAGGSTVGIRMPENTIARELIRLAGVPIAAPSANISGKPSPTDIERCIEDLQGRVDYIIGGEKCTVGVESTVVDCTVEPPCILRPGGITLEMLKKVHDDTYIDGAILKKPEKDFKPKAPGMKYRHYAPKAPVRIINGDIQKTIEKINEIVQNYIDRNMKVGIIATEETKSSYPYGEVISLGSRSDMRSIAKNLFEALRKMDDKNVDIILSEAFEEEGIGVAVMNRLKKAAAFEIINVF